MIPTQQNMPLSQGKIATAVNLDVTSSLLRQIISTSQVRNVQEQPSMSDAEKISSKQFALKASKERQYQVLDLLLNVLLLGKESLKFYPEEKAYLEDIPRHCLTFSQQTELSNYREHINAGEYALVYLARLKNSIVDLIDKDSEVHKKATISRNRALGVIARYLLNYQRLSDILETEQRNKAMQNEPTESKLRGPKLKSEGFEILPKKVEEQIRAQYIRYWFFLSLSKIFVAIPLQEIQATVCKAMKNFNLASPLPTASLLKFTPDRAILDRVFWDQFDENVEPEQLIEKVYQFIFSSWENEIIYDKELVRDLSSTTKKKWSKMHFQLLSLKYFQKELKINALSLVEYLLWLKTYKEDIMAAEEKKKPLNSIRHFPKEVFDLEHFAPQEAYLAHTYRLKDSDRLIEKQLLAKIKILRTKNDTARKRIHRLESKVRSIIDGNYQYLNEQLNICRNKKMFTRYEITSLAAPFIERHNRLCAVYSNQQLKRPPETSLGSWQPAQKKAALTIELPKKPPSSAQIQFIAYGIAQASTSENEMLLSSAKKNNEDNLAFHQEKNPFSEALQFTDQNTSKPQLPDNSQNPVINFITQPSDPHSAAIPPIFGENEIMASRSLTELFPALSEFSLPYSEQNLPASTQDTFKFVEPILDTSEFEAPILNAFEFDEFSLETICQQNPMDRNE